MSGGMSARGKLRLTPMPTITNRVRPGSQASSLRMPATFLPWSRTSLGHLMRGAPGTWSLSVSATATAASSVIFAESTGSSRGRRTNEMYRLRLAGEIHCRPILP